MYIPKDQVVHISKRGFATFLIPVILGVAAIVFIGCVIVSMKSKAHRSYIKQAPSNIANRIDQRNRRPPPIFLNAIAPVLPPNPIETTLPPTIPIQTTIPIAVTPQFIFSPPDEPPPAYQRNAT
ncbi:hypothetical protein DFJ63DRAFT_334398 [Scheffersomyces coipomensis]|uniref:uncharacterized protein n=1 Tax=Scheffersomyces coipomensis TaxID=1788519 RepID=UPI00315D12EE